jgi:hypothetical protein
MSNTKTNAVENWHSFIDCRQFSKKIGNNIFTLLACFSKRRLWGRFYSPFLPVLLHVLWSAGSTLYLLLFFARVHQAISFHLRPALWPRLTRFDVSSLCLVAFGSGEFSLSCWNVRNRSWKFKWFAHGVCQEVTSQFPQVPSASAHLRIHVTLWLLRACALATVAVVTLQTIDNFKG